MVVLGTDMVDAGTVVEPDVGVVETGKVVEIGADVVDLGTVVEPGTVEVVSGIVLVTSGTVVLSVVVPGVDIVLGSVGKVDSNPEPVCSCYENSTIHQLRKLLTC